MRGAVFKGDVIMSGPCMRVETMVNADAILVRSGIFGPE